MNSDPQLTIIIAAVVVGLLVLLSIICILAICIVRLCQRPASKVTADVITENSAYGLQLSKRDDKIPNSMTENRAYGLSKRDDKIPDSMTENSAYGLTRIDPDDDDTGDATHVYDVIDR